MEVNVTKDRELYYRLYDAFLNDYQTEFGFIEEVQFRDDPKEESVICTFTFKNNLID